MEKNAVRASVNGRGRPPEDGPERTLEQTFGAPHRPAADSSPNGSRAGAPRLARLGIPWLWGADVEKGWVFMRFNVVPVTTRWLAPGSYSYGLDRLPATGGAVLAINHLSAIDPPLVGSFSNRAIFYMTKAELLELPLVGEALTWAGGFPVRRGGGDREAIRKGCKLAREGHVVGVFVEGTRQRFGYPGAVHPGAVTIALKEGVPVIPVGLESFGWTRANRRACCVVWGEPITLDWPAAERTRLQGRRGDPAAGDPRSLASGGRGRRGRLPARARGRHQALQLAARPPLPPPAHAAAGQRDLLASRNSFQNDASSLGRDGCVRCKDAGSPDIS